MVVHGGLNLLSVEESLRSLALLVIRIVAGAWRLAGLDCELPMEVGNA